MKLPRLGIEIRKIGNMDGLYKEVDMVLSKVGEGEVQFLSVAHALQKMICVENYFDVCTIRSCSEMCQICIPRERMLVYSSAHCIRWNEMTQEYRQLLVAMVLDDFRTVLNPQ